MIYVLPVYVLVPLIMYIVCVVVMICLLCSPFTSEVFSDLHNSSTCRQQKDVKVSYPVMINRG